MSIVIRSATEQDASLIVALLRDAADQQALPARFSEADVRSNLFSAAPRVFCDIAELDDEPVGLALWFYNFNSFAGQAGIWLEDLYVRPSVRAAGVGRALLAGLARRCDDEGLAAVEWSVAAENTGAQAFYARIGAVSKSGWIGQRLSGDALRKLAGR